MPYEYGLTLRPVSFATVPSGFKAFGKSDKYPHGTVVYDKPLLRSAIEHFDLAPLDPRDPVNVRRRCEARMQYVYDRFVQDDVVRATYPNGTVLLLTRSTNGENPFRVTTICANGVPSGHREYGDIISDRQIDSAAGEFLSSELTFL